MAEILTFENLLAGDYPVVTDIITIVAGAGNNLAAGAVLGRIAATGKYTLNDKAALDGSQVASAVLAEACDASAADKEAVVLLSGAVNEAKLTFAAGTTIADARAALRDQNIYAKKTVAA